jgi:DDE superfamily endonuclease
MADGGRVGAFGDLAAFRQGFYDSLTARADALFELGDALLCAEGPVASLPGLSLAGEHRRGHGSLYDGLRSGRIDVAALRRSVTAAPLPRDSRGRIRLAVDVSPWLRPDAETSAERAFCHVHGRCKGSSQFIPGWPYSFVAALETGRTSWTALLDAVRIGRGQDPTEVTAAQVREVVDRLRAAGQHRTGDENVLIVFDAGYDLARLAYLLADCPVDLVGRVRSDRVFRFPVPPRRPGTNGRPPVRGPQFAFDNPDTHPEPDTDRLTATTRYGTARARCWHRLSPRLQRRGAWADHDGTLPELFGSVIELRVEHLPGDRDPKPVWLWCSRSELTADDADRAWQSFLRRFDLEHTFRFCKQTLGWTRPRVRTPSRATAGPG